jgi:ribonucleoside-diphosphate reductase alpha chain
MGLKAVAIYRDGSKMLQPVQTKKHKDGKSQPASAEAANSPRPFRRRLSDTRHSITHKFSVAGHEGYLTVGLYEDGQPGELFITMAKEGSTVGGLMDVIGTCTSMSLQYGVPLITLVDKFRHARFEPAGMTSNRDIPFAKSIIDYIFCWLGCQFIPGYAEKNTPNRSAETVKENKNTTTAKQLVEKTKDLAQKIAEAKAEVKTKLKSVKEAKSISESKSSGGNGEKITPAVNRISSLVEAPIVSQTGQDGAEGQVMQAFNAQFEHFQDDAPVCDICGSITVRNGTCYKCFNCGNSMGCS